MCVVPSIKASYYMFLRPYNSIAKNSYITCALKLKCVKYFYLHTICNCVYLYIIKRGKIDDMSVYILEVFHVAYTFSNFVKLKPLVKSLYKWGLTFMNNDRLVFTKSQAHLHGILMNMIRL